MREFRKWQKEDRFQDETTGINYVPIWHPDRDGVLAERRAFAELSNNPTEFDEWIAYYYS